VIDVDADERVRERTQELHVRISAAPHHDRLDERSRVFERVYQRAGSGDVEMPLFPLRMVLVPRRGDARRVFELVAISRGADGNELTQTRVISGYMEHQIRHVRVQLTARCVGISCGDFESCQAGACGEAWREPRDLPLLGSRADRARLPEAAIDAEVVDAATDADAAEELDAATDSSVRDGATDAGNDAGPPPPRCEVENGGCDPLVSCANGDGGVLCGQCPRGFWDQHGDGTRCPDIDECQANNGGCDPAHASCTNTPGGYECRCETGYYGDGRECTRNVPCVDDPAVLD
jgi:hypothetical protein